MQTIRPFVLLVCIIFWQGGFMFYGGVVVPVGARVLGSDTRQGFVTQSVTNYLNVAGVVCLAVWLEALFHATHRRVAKMEWLLWCLNALFLLGLFVVHRQMDTTLDIKSTEILEPARFGLFHKAYIGISSLQWMTSLLSLFLMQRRWSQRQHESIPKSC